MKLEIAKVKKQNKKSQIKEFFDKLVAKMVKEAETELKEVMEQNGYKNVIDLLNDILLENKLTIKLSDEEFAEFQRVSKRDYYRYTDSCTLHENGTYSTNRYNAQCFIDALRNVGIKPPIRVTISLDKSDAKLSITFTRYVR